MDTFLHIVQWIVSIIGFFALCFPLYAAYQEHKALGIIGAVLAPIALPVLAILYRMKYPTLQAVLLFILMYAAAAGCQRLRFGFWDWPDVDYQPPAAEAE